jgi:hypothetical protein
LYLDAVWWEMQAKQHIQVVQQQHIIIQQQHSIIKQQQQINILQQQTSLMYTIITNFHSKLRAQMQVLLCWVVLCLTLSGNIKTLFKQTISQCNPFRQALIYHITKSIPAMIAATILGMTTAAVRRIYRQKRNNLHLMKFMKTPTHLTSAHTYTYTPPTHTPLTHTHTHMHTHKTQHIQNVCLCTFMLPCACCAYQLHNNVVVLP